MFAPAARGARFVVSDRGDILSPKYEPPTTAAAVIGRGIPSPWAITIKTTPMVAHEPQEVPVQVERIAQIIKAVTKKNFGFTIWIP